MKTIIQFVILLAIIAISASCSTSKKGMKGVVRIPSETLYTQAVAALETRNFIIEADGDFYFPNQESRINRTMRGSEPAKTDVGGGNFISVQDSQIEIRFAPGVLPGRQITNQQQQPVIHFDSKLKRNGDHIYTLKTEAGQHYNSYEIIIQLFDNSNQCHLYLNTSTGKPITNFPGKVTPYLARMR